MKHLSQFAVLIDAPFVREKYFCLAQYWKQIESIYALQQKQ